MMNRREESLWAIFSVLLAPVGGKIKLALQSFKLTRQSASFKGVWLWCLLLTTGMIPRQLGWLKLTVHLN